MRRPHSKAWVWFKDELANEEVRRAPSWRWQVAQAFFQEYDLDIRELGPDKILYELVRWYRARRRFYTTGEGEPPVSPAGNAMRIFAYKSNPNGVRWALDGYIMAGLSDEEISDIFPKLSTETIGFYRGIFQDMDGALDETEDVDTIVSCHQTRDSFMQDWDYYWKIFAHKWGPEAFTSLRKSNHTLMDGKLLKWFREIHSQKQQMHSWVMGCDIRTKFNAAGLAAMSNAQKYLVLEDDKKGRVSEVDLAKFLLDISLAIEPQLISAEEKLPREEKLGWGNLQEVNMSEQELIEENTAG